MILPEAFRLGCVAFDRRHFFAAHEHWESVWRAAASDERPLYRSLIKLAAGCLKIEQQAYQPAVRLLREAHEGLLDAHAIPGIDLPALRQQLQRLVLQLEALGPDRLAEFDPRWFPTLAAS